MEQRIRPVIKAEELTSSYGRITIEPLERGFGVTLGNPLRRVLLSSIPGAAVTRVRFDGHYHEYDTLPGVKEDLLEIILNFKELALRLEGEAEGSEPLRLELEAKGPGEVTAAKLETPKGVEILNPDLHIATLDEGGQLRCELEVEPGVGYRPAERNKRKDMPLGVIPVDSDFSPIKLANFKVEPTRVGERTDYERLILEIETNGGIRPMEALKLASSILIEHFQIFHDFATHPEGRKVELEEPPELSMTLTKLDFDHRACNLLEARGVITLKDLLAKTREEISDIHGFGEKTLEKVERRLAELGYSLKSEKEKRGAPSKEGE
ncbi:MAG: DNA-directed RNA polymerase subunit alpha [Candidatus Bipolaricaulia bacterium]